MSFESNNAAISLDGISKKYKLFKSTQERVREALHPFKKKYHREFWALSDINLEIPSGRTFGIIGRNGSGKSTLLQIISGVLQPTSGSVKVKGRISALLELGAGFNPEFTGRENVYLNGALMGFSKQEMKKRLPLVEAFADIGEFVDQPVKIYSSGMFVRLAFAAAIHVDPDILIIDEALAVGDAKFQHKCYQKIIEFQNQGKTIIMVTHDMGAILKHCDQAIVLESGHVVQTGSPKEVIHYYHELVLSGSVNSKNGSLLDGSHKSSEPSASLTETPLDQFLRLEPSSDHCVLRNSYNPNEYRFGDERGKIVDYLIVCEGRYDPAAVYSGERIDIYVKATFLQNVELPLYGFSVKSLDGIVIYASNTRFKNAVVNPVASGDRVTFKFSIELNMTGGDFFMDLGIAEKLPAKDAPVDIRMSMIHLFVQCRERFDGFMQMDTDFQEISVVSKNLMGLSIKGG